MTGPEHFEQAELALNEAGCEYGCPHSGCPHEMRLIARAQAHATLALTAAKVTEMGIKTGAVPLSAVDAWHEVITP